MADTPKVKAKDIKAEIVRSNRTASPIKLYGGVVKRYNAAIRLIQGLFIRVNRSSDGLEIHIQSGPFSGTRAAL